MESRDLLSGFTPLYVLAPQAGSATPQSTTGPTGYSPSQISQAYGFNQISFQNGAVKGNGNGQTIAIVDAYNDPNIPSDLAAFDKQFGLSAAPSFRVVNQSGGTALPAADSGWATEISLDVEWAHAIAPGANLLLVEANSSNYSDLFSAVQYAASQPGVSVVSMSWGGGEFSSESSYDSVFTTPSGHQGVSFIASSGDSGAPASYPAVSPNVLAVGGTTLHLSGSTYSSESAWSGSTGGLSAYEAQPTYQQGVVTQSSTQRANPDVSYDANPNTGFSVYDSYGHASAPWLQVGGTSAGAPQWAALVAIADQGRVLNGEGTLDSGKQLLPDLYALPSSDFHDVTSGSSTGSPSYSAGPGYDLVTGRGSPAANLIVNALVGQSTSTGGGSSGSTGGGSTGSGTATNPAPTPNLIEGFETSDSWYVANATSPTAYLSTAAAHDGAYGLDDYNGDDWIYRTDTAAQVKAGDTLSVWLQFSGSADGRAYFGFGASSSGTLSLVAAPNSNQLLLQQNPSYNTYTTLGAASATYQPNHWYRLEVDWSTSGKITGKLYDSNGTTLLQTVTASTTAITSGGIAFRAIGSDKYWDTVTDTPGVNTSTAPASVSAVGRSARQVEKTSPVSPLTAIEQALMSFDPSMSWVPPSGGSSASASPAQQAVDYHFASTPPWTQIGGYMGHKLKGSLSGAFASANEGGVEG